MITIWLYDNKLSGIHPNTFSHLNLHRLNLIQNICIDEDFDHDTPDTIEEALAECGVGYNEYVKN